MMVQALIGRKAQELSPCTARHIRATLRAALSFAIKNRLITFNAASRIECAKDDHEIKPLTSEEAARLLQTAEGTPIGMMLVLAVRLGLRRGELLGLEWRDVDFAERTLKIERAVQRIKGRPLVAVPLKTKNSKRVIRIGEEVVRALREHKADQTQQRLAGTEWHDMGLIFCNSIGKPWEPRAVNALFDRCVEHAGLPPATRLHDCRHTCATLLLAAGADLLSVSRMLGHATIGVTADLRPSEPRKRRAPDPRHGYRHGGEIGVQRPTLKKALGRTLGRVKRPARTSLFRPPSKCLIYKDRFCRWFLLRGSPGPSNLSVQVPVQVQYKTRGALGFERFWLTPEVTPKTREIASDRSDRRLPISTPDIFMSFGRHGTKGLFESVGFWTNRLHSGRGRMNWRSVP
jgi:integrase